MFLKSYEGDAADLALTFSISIDFAGKEQEIELISGGSRKDVTNGNKYANVCTFFDDLLDHHGQAGVHLSCRLHAHVWYHQETM